LGERIVMSAVTSAGHKLGQMLGDFFESTFSQRLEEIAKRNALYLDKKGKIRAARGNQKKVTWTDTKGNKHDMDYVFERNGADDIIGEPVAFIELMWRRYTKHSRNKAGEIQGALLPLRDAYRRSCSFVGAIIGGEFTEGALRQLQSQGIEVLHVPYKTIVKVFSTKGVNLDYPEKADDSLKKKLIDSLNRLSENDIGDVSKALVSSIEQDYNRFVLSLTNSLLRKVESVRILSLNGDEVTFVSISEAIKAMESDNHLGRTKGVRIQKFEIYIRFSNNDRIEGVFHERKAALDFLKTYE